MPDVQLSVIIPAYNEEKTIKGSLEKIIRYCSKNFSRFEIIVIDDGSIDSTFAICKKFTNSPDFFLLSNIKNMGKGYSVKRGVIKARGNLILYTDADLSVPITELGKLLPYMVKYDLVMGSRAVKGSKVKTTLSKKILGRMSNFFISSLVYNIKDSQCGFKLLKKSAAKKLFSKMKLDKWGFDVELLYLARKFQYIICEIPITWHLGPQSKVRLYDYPKTLFELTKIKTNDWRGYYNDK